MADVPWGSIRSNALSVKKVARTAHTSPRQLTARAGERNGFLSVVKEGRGSCPWAQDEQMKGTAMLSKQAVIAAALGLGLAMGSGPTSAAPIGLQGLPSHAVIGDRAATVEPVHYRQRRYAYPRYRYGYAYPRYRYGYAYPQYGYAYPQYGYGYAYPRYGYGYPYRYRTRPRVSFGLSFGW
jgi:hypothetical protein